MEKNKNNFLIKIETIRKNSYGGRNFLKSGDIIVALNNQLYTFGEKQFTEELREIKKSNTKAILTILRNNIFFDIIVENSLGCKFLSITPEETKEIQVKYKSKKIYDFDDLTEFVVMRDVYEPMDITAPVMVGRTYRMSRKNLPEAIDIIKEIDEMSDYKVSGLVPVMHSDFQEAVILSPLFLQMCIIRACDSWTNFKFYRAGG